MDLHALLMTARCSDHAIGAPTKLAMGHTDQVAIRPGISLERMSKKALLGSPSIAYHVGHMGAD